MQWPAFQSQLLQHGLSDYRKIRSLRRYSWSSCKQRKISRLFFSCEIANSLMLYMRIALLSKQDKSNVIQEFSSIKVICTCWYFSSAPASIKNFQDRQWLYQVLHCIRKQARQLEEFSYFSNKELQKDNTHQLKKNHMIWSCKCQSDLHQKITDWIAMQVN